MDTRKVLVICFVISGACAAFGGILLAGWSNRSFQAMGDPYLLPTIAAVVLGGTHVLGGRGTYLGTVAGVLLITLLQSILSVVQPQYMLADLGLKVPPESIRQIVFGMVIVGMMLIYGRERLSGDGNGDGRRRGRASPAARHRRNGSSGSGKTVVGSGLATALGGRFAEGDRFHPSENIARMSAGMPLRDEDRWDWLDAIADEIARAALDGEGAGGGLLRIEAHLPRPSPGAPPRTSCSSTSTSTGIRPRRKGGARKGHFMPASLIDSQFAALELPGPDEMAVSFDAETSGRRAGRGGCCGASGRHLS